MNRRPQCLGPWTTSLDSGPQLQLSLLWKQRMRALPRLLGNAPRRRAIVVVLGLSSAIAAMPLVQVFSKPSHAEEVQPDAESSKSAENQTAKDKGSPLLRRLRQAGAPLLEALRDQHGYALGPKENVKRIAPPFPDARMEWYRVANPTQFEHIPAGPDAMLFRWENNRLRNWGMSFGGYDLDDVVEATAGIHPQWIEGPAELREKELPGDWIVRPTASREEILTELERILNRELSMGVRLRLAEVERDVYVACGKYKFKPLPGQPAVDETQLTDRVSRTDPIQIFGAELAPDSGAGGGMGNFQEFCDWLGEWVAAPIVIEVDQPPRGELSWRLHERSPFTDAERARAHDPKLVLPNISKQTGLEFTRERRPVKVLFVEHDQAKPPRRVGKERSP
jgi:hypothetical protein